MHQADTDDLVGMINAIGGEDMVKIEKADTQPANNNGDQPPKPLDQMTMVEQLQWNAEQMRKRAEAKKKALEEKKVEAPVSTQGDSSGFDPNKPPKPLDQMTMVEQLQWNSEVMKWRAEAKRKAQEEKKAEAKQDSAVNMDSDVPPKPLDQMSLQEQL